MTVSILSNIAKHIVIDAAETDYFLSLLETNIIKRNAFVLEAGKTSRSLTFVTRGCLRTYTTDDAGKDHILLFSPEDWWCSDLFSFYTRRPATYNIDALEETEVMQITTEKLELLYQKVPKFERFFRILFQNGFIMYQQRIISELALPAEQKYANFKQLYPQLEQRIAQKHIASYLGITPVFLSMLRKRY